MTAQEKDERTLQQMKEELNTLQDRPHRGYEDASRAARLRSDIEALEVQLSREKQRAAHSEG